MRRIIIVLTLSVLLSGQAKVLSPLTVTTALASPLMNVTNNEVILNFPETATFRARIISNANITSVVLEYGSEQQTCSQVIAKAFPQFTSGRTVNVEWVWEMRQSGSLPPGATLWWRWRTVDANGKELVSETKTTTWLDNIHKWKTINNGDSQSVRLHW